MLKWEEHVVLVLLQWVQRQTRADGVASFSWCWKVADNTPVVLTYKTCSIAYIFVACINESCGWFMCCALRHGHHYCCEWAELNTFTLTVGAEMFGIVTVGSHPLLQIKGVSVNVEVIEVTKHLSDIGYDSLSGKKITLMHHFWHLRSQMWKLCVEFKPSSNYLPSYDLNDQTPWFLTL